MTEETLKERTIDFTKRGFNYGMGIFNPRKASVMLGYTPAATIACKTWSDLAEQDLSTPYRTFLTIGASLATYQLVKWGFALLSATVSGISGAVSHGIERTRTEERLEERL